MVEFIGFIISLLALLFIFIKQNSQNMKRERHGGPVLINAEEKEEDENDPYRDFMRTLKKESAMEEKLKQARKIEPPRAPIQAKKDERRFPLKSPLQDNRLESKLEDYRIESKIEDRRLKSTLEERKLKSKFRTHEELPKHVHGTVGYHIHPIDEPGAKKPSRVKLIVKNLHRPINMIVYHEIIGKPKALRREAPFHDN